MSDQEDILVVGRVDDVAVLRLNRPAARNALSPALIDQLGTALGLAEADPGVRAIVLTGTGDRVFCAGMDLRGFVEGETIDRDSSGLRDFQRHLRGQIKVPVVGAANGSALAGGLELLLGCDLIVMAEEAKIGLPEVRRGLFPAGGGTLLGSRIPLSLALELALTGDPMDAQWAQRVGLVNAVVPADDVMEVALRYATRIAANGPLGVKAAKELVRLAVDDAEASRVRLGELQSFVFESDDAKEGARAFVEKRAPSWRGR
jgi:enoyl-CoA hydratase/carnithine racemase